MIKRLVPAFACAAAIGFGSDADARGFTISDFGAVSSDPVCVAKGRRLFEAYGADEILTTDWTVNAYGVGGEAIDAAVVCAYGPDGKTQVTIVLHSWGDADEDARRRAIPDKLRPIWDNL